MDTYPQETRESVRKAAVAAYEALPAILLAAALLMPALAALATKAAERETQVELGQAISVQGNQALADIRAETRVAAIANLTLPKLP
ncbi:MAG: hypothetical protein ACT4PK_06600 [Gammaproteobacteria bacterium]